MDRMPGQSEPAATLSPTQVAQGRSAFHAFMALNVVGFSILTGNVVTLFALSFGVDYTFVGLMQAFVYLALVFTLVGRLLLARFGSVQLFAWAWLLRYLFAALLLLMPWVDRQFGGTTATLVILIATAGFNLFRGIGIAGQVPITAGLSVGSDRGKFLAANNVVGNGFALASSIGVAFVLGPAAPAARYVLCFAIAVIAGVASVYFVRRLPEPVQSAAGVAAAGRHLRLAVRSRSIRGALIFSALFGVVAATLAGFLVVASDRLYGLDDSFSALLVAVGNVGAIAAGLANRSLIDRLGARPLLRAFQGVTTVMCIALGVLLPVGAAAPMITLAVAFGIARAAYNGILVAGQSYYYGAIPADSHRNLGPIYPVAIGIAGALGSISGGFFLDRAVAVVGTMVAFQALFVAVGVVALVGFLVAAALPQDHPENRSLGASLAASLVRRFTR